MFDLEFFLTGGDLKRNGIPPRPDNLDWYRSHTNNCFEWKLDRDAHWSQRDTYNKYLRESSSYIIAA